MLVFFIILTILILLSLMIYLSSIRIEIDTIKIDNKKGLRINDFKIKVCIVLFNKIKWIKLRLDKEKIDKNKKTNIKKLLIKKLNLKIVEDLKNSNIIERKGIVSNAIKVSKTQLERLCLKAEIGIDNVILLSYIVAILDILIGINLARQVKHFKRENYKYVIKPLQTEKIYLKISINCIISLKIANIINMIIMNRSEEKHERTSNRSFNGNYHEQYTRHGRCKHYYRSTNGYK